MLKVTANIYQGFSIKSFPGWSVEIIDSVASNLEKSSIPVKATGGREERYWLKFGEVFELPDGIKIRFIVPETVDPKIAWIHPRTGFDISIEVGPENEDNRDLIEEIKGLIDELDM